MIPFANQTNTQQGDWQPIANSNLNGLAPRLVKLVNNAASGVIAADVPAADTDIVTNLLVDDGAPDSSADTTGQPVTVRPILTHSQLRVTAKGAITPGDLLVLADPSVIADKGKLRTLPAAAGTYTVRGQALDAAIDGSLVKFHPLAPYTITH
jgi:hypothetical protein